MATTHPGTTVEQRTSGKQIWLAGLLAALVSTVINVVLALVLRAALDISDEFSQLQPVAVVLNTVVATLLGTALYQLISRRARRPLRTFAIVVGVVLVISMVPPLLLLGMESSPHYPGLSNAAALALLPLHLPPAAVLLYLLSRLRRP
ncbi:DUF6069 family protein [Micromonospora sp. NPDC049903]|uniref:DUF6069 family protein n=1 Tax=Micromonospora sp. NPDC049903 TaxID=3364276 RepID=UPI0037B857D4